MRLPAIGLVTAALGFAIACGVAVAAEPSAFAYDQFKPSVIGTIAADTEAINLPGTGKRIMYMANTLTKVRVTVTYEGTSRPLTPDEAKIIQGFVKATPGAPPNYAELYKESFAFGDAGRRYWMPVQHPVAAYFAKELKPGQRVQLFAVVAGGLAESERLLEPVLLVQEFDADPATTH